MYNYMCVYKTLEYTCACIPGYGYGISVFKRDQKTYGVLVCFKIKSLILLTSEVTVVQQLSANVNTWLNWPYRND